MENKRAWKITIGCVFFVAGMFLIWFVFKIGVVFGELRGMNRADAVISQAIADVETAEHEMGAINWLFGGKDNCDAAKTTLLHVQREIKARTAEDNRSK